MNNEEQDAYFNEMDSLEQRFMNVGLDIPERITSEWLDILEELEKASTVKTILNNVIQGEANVVK